MGRKALSSRDFQFASGSANGRPRGLNFRRSRGLILLRPAQQPCPAQGGFLNLGLATVIPDVLRELGTYPKPILRETGLSHHFRRGKTYRLSVNALGKLLRLCAERANCPHFGLLAGGKITLSAFGNLGSLMRGSETCGDALRVLEIYRRLQSN